MNEQGIYNRKDFGKIVKIDRTGYNFPNESGMQMITGTTACRYWGKKDNLILLVNADDGRKLKFSFWKNTKYCCEPSPKRAVSETESVRHLPDGSRIRLIFEKSPGARITRVREIFREQV